jgi:thiol-disulfide isomerase/thioredoxin
MVTIYGVNKTPLKGEVSINLLSLDNGTLKTFATTSYGANGVFGFLVSIPSEGFYAIGNENLLNGQHPVYLKPGDVVEVVLDNKHMTFTAKNTPENVVLGRWLELSKDVKAKSLYFNTSRSTYVDFFPDLEILVDKAKGFVKSINTPNAGFNKAMANVVGYDLDMFAINMLYTPRAKHPSRDSLSAFYSTIVKENRFPDDDVLNTIYGLRTLTMYVSFASRNAKPQDLAKDLSLLSTDRQMAEFLCYTSLGRIKTYDDYLTFTNNYGKYFVEPYLKLKLEAKGAEVYSTKAGTVAADFTYPDASGKPVSLSSFKGKVVLVDVWATWCGPCKGEIPSLKKLEEEMHGTDLVVMSVSVDEDKDKEKWIKMIADEKLGGVQLFASGWSKICKDYKITGIPRFMVFDKKGNVVTVDAPRPSDPKLKELLKAELSK